MTMSDCGSQNFTSYSRGSRETTAAPTSDVSSSRFVETLERWFDEVEPVDLALIERLLDTVQEPIAQAKAAIEALVAAYEAAAAPRPGHRPRQ